MNNVEERVVRVTAIYVLPIVNVIISVAIFCYKDHARCWYNYFQEENNFLCVLYRLYTYCA